MAVEAESAGGGASWWYDKRTRAIIMQVVVISLFVAFVAYIVNNTFVNNDTSVHCFEKNLGLNGGTAVIKNTIISNSGSVSIFSDSLSSITVSYSLSDTEMMAGEGNIFSNPYFIEPSIYNFSLQSNSPCVDGGDPSDEFDEDTLHMRQLLKTELTEFGLSVRALNCLKTAEVYTLGELVSFKKSDMLKFRNFGKKSLTELEELIEAKGLTFGYDTAKYNLID